MLEKPETPPTSPDSDDELEGMDIDLALFLDCSKPLSQSRNPAVVLALAKAYYHLAPIGHKLVGQELLVSPLLRLTGSKGDEVKALAWDVIATMSEERPVSLYGAWLISRYFELASQVHSSTLPTLRRSCWSS